VGGLQKLTVAGASKVELSTEVVVVAGAVLEQVGNPVKGLKNLAMAAVIAAPGAAAGFCSGLTETLLDKGGVLLKMGFAGYQYQQAQAAGGKSDHGVSATALGGALLGGAADLLGIPGTEGLAQAADQIADANAEAAEAKEAEGEGTGKKGEAPEAKPGGGSAEPGGGAKVGGPKGGAAEAGGAGKRDTGVKGVMIELIGAAHHVVTPGSVSWSGLAAAGIVVGGSHVTRALKYGYSVGGPMTVNAGAVYITAKKEIVRDVKGPVTTTIAGALSRDATGDQMIKVEGSKLTIDVGGTLTIKGETVFESGSSKVVIGSGGVTIKSSQVEYNGHVVYKAPDTCK
jgi:type VI secretion system secreted protein VgrG